MPDECRQPTPVTRVQDLLISPDMHCGYASRRLGGGQGWGRVGAGDRALEGPEAMLVVSMDSPSLPLTWVALAAASTTTLDVCSTSTGPGSYPGHVLEVVWQC